MIDTSHLKDAVIQVGELGAAAAPFVKIAVDAVKLWHIRRASDLLYPRILAYVLAALILFSLLLLSGNSAADPTTYAAALLGSIPSLVLAIASTESHKAARNREPGT